MSPPTKLIFMPSNVFAALARSCTNDCFAGRFWGRRGVFSIQRGSRARLLRADSGRSKLSKQLPGISVRQKSKLPFWIFLRKCPWPRGTTERYARTNYRYYTVLKIYYTDRHRGPTMFMDVISTQARLGLWVYVVTPSEYATI